MAAATDWGVTGKGMLWRVSVGAQAASATAITLSMVTFWMPSWPRVTGRPRLMQN